MSLSLKSVCAVLVMLASSGALAACGGAPDGTSQEDTLADGDASASQAAPAEQAEGPAETAKSKTPDEVHPSGSGCCASCAPPGGGKITCK